MAQYIPKSKVSILETTGTEFIVDSTKAPYKGKYMEISNGSFFAGSNPNNPGNKLIKIKKLNNSFGVSLNNKKYRKIKKPIHNTLNKKENIIPSKSDPTIEDLKNGYFTRYFCKRANERINYFEISEETYNSILTQDPKYDFNLYIIGNIKWNLIRTNLKLVEEINKNLLNLKSVEFPFIETLFTNLNEYEPPYTEGNELFTRSKNKETSYVGYYHFHPEFGYAMTGAFHVPTKHKRLFEKQKTIDRGVIQQVDTPTVQTPRMSIPTPTTPTPSTTPSIAPSRPSYGGGGGY